MGLDQRLLDILACPQDKRTLWYFEDESILYNPRIKCVYSIVDGIPVLLVDEATTVDEAEHIRLATKHGSA